MNQRATGEIVLLTGSSGFLGRRILDYLLEDVNVKEVRGLDKVKFSLSHDKLKLFHCDLLDVESCREAFHNVDVVLHCAAYVSYEYPADREKLEKNNVQATQNVVDLSISSAVKRLVHCSTTEVTLQPCIRGGIIAVTIYKQESKLEIPKIPSRLLFGDYASSKLAAEKIVLQADRVGGLRTTVLRPTPIYGENDPHLLPEIMRWAKKRKNTLPRLGSGGKQQMTYVGNAAWAFVRAKDTMRDKIDAIAGLPVTVTDDTMVEDLTRFCERVTRSTKNHVKITGWPMPLLVAYFLAFVLELLVSVGLLAKQKIAPRSFVAYLNSIIIYNRARASIHMNYWPKYNHEQTLAMATSYYAHLCSDDD
ncbi:3 beta-hydroxysteroid dehydrogenase/Delta 5--_4-isomerase type 4 [Trichogramma pretiosum]|uniref:3 beta-hydroxysteroid dehydrogenase/Delta 5-->4-isomerase type 4 n=1 Tax=Trichogramma pretiosum TaxID=7493 RepID=UPI0006C9606A|nr:3 beta-hydroxysteroid dehydrogenase/Delta 5-->4-isomerase type 4 [Trichogramma pretiosum]